MAGKPALGLGPRALSTPFHSGTWAASLLAANDRSRCQQRKAPLPRPASGLSGSRPRLGSYLLPANTPKSVCARPGAPLLPLHAALQTSELTRGARLPRTRPATSPNSEIGMTGRFPGAVCGLLCRYRRGLCRRGAVRRDAPQHELHRWPGGGDNCDPGEGRRGTRGPHEAPRTDLGYRRA